MNKTFTVFKTLLNTKVVNRSKISFMWYFFLTHLMGFSLRKLPSFGLFLKKRFDKIESKEFIIKNKTGIWSVYPFNDTMTISADYFEKELSLWPSKTNQKRIFLDIGANIGRYTLIATNTYHYSKVISIEANPITAKILHKNIELNNIQQKVIIKNVAVGNQDGEVRIQSNSHHLGGGNVVREHSNVDHMENIHRVALTTVSDIIKSENIDPAQIDFIKMDVEGMENEVIEGMEYVLQNMPKGSACMMEISGDNNPTIKTLSDFGFEKVESSNSDYLFIKK